MLIRILFISLNFVIVNFLIKLKIDFLGEAENYHLEEKKRRKSSFLFNEVGKNQEMNFNNFEDILFNTSFKREAPEDFLMH